MARQCHLLVSFLIFTTAVAQLPSQDILALLAFKKGIKHDPTNYILSSWNEESMDFNSCPASWNGIICNGQHVAGVVLDNLGLSADAELSVFANLTMLVKISMSNNSISGILPDNIGDFKKIQYIDISDNLFSSSLPSGIGGLTSLRNLSLAGNNFSGAIPNSVSGFTSIQLIDLSRNSFSGSLPSSLTKLDSLVYLNLSSNDLTKKIPEGFELLPNLEVLDLHGNMLDGTLDEGFFLFSHATYVDLSSNRLISPGSSQQKFLPGISESIIYLNLSHNQLTGSLVSAGEPSTFENLKVLDLSYNKLSGELPEFSFVYDLDILRLSNNMFSGFVPNNLLKGDALVLTELDLSGNNLSGPISMITSTTLLVLNLSSNGLSGELPLLTGDCATLDLSRNQFEGNLTKMAKWANIEFLDLSHNRLTGSIPEVTTQFLRLNFVNLSHNSLSGSLPRAITEFPKLVILDLSFNQLDGHLQSDLLNMPTLQELYLAGNSLVGNISLSPASAETNLQILDLSHNHLGGFFPDRFQSLTKLQVLNLAENNISGSLPTSMNDISSLTSLDISQNGFTGSLPGNLSSNLQSFNVSYNDLSGVVPESLRKFPRSSFFPGNSRLELPNTPGSPENPPAQNSKKKRLKTIVKVVIVVSCVAAFVVLILLAIFIYYVRISRKPLPDDSTYQKQDFQRRLPQDPSGVSGRHSAGLVVSAEELVTSRKGSSSEIACLEEKMPVVTGFSPSKSNLSGSPESGDSFAADSLSRLDVGSPDQLAGDLHLLDDSIALTPEELSKAPAEVLGRSSHGTSYRATLDNGVLLTVKWLREGLARPKKEFAKEAKKFANIRHPNVVALRGYYCGPTQHERLILSDYISPGSLASFLYDRPGRRGPPLIWIQRLKIAVDVARGLNYLHFDRALPHGNLKATNVILEGPDLNGHVADYCLHRLMTQAGTTEQVLDSGALGYRAPELAGSKKPVPSFKSDVYAFGVMLLELLTGRCAGDVVAGEEGGGIELADWVRLRVAEGRGVDCCDRGLGSEKADPVAAKGMKDVLGIALRCIRPVSERPGIRSIYEELSSV